MHRSSCRPRCSCAKDRIRRRRRSHVPPQQSLEQCGLSPAVDCDRHPTGSIPSKISALALATPVSPSGKLPTWTGSTLVTIAMCGRTIRVSGRISPAWFMPISNTANCVSAGMRASVSGTPQWLLNDFSGACVAPGCRGEARAQHLLGAGLAGASGDRNDARPRRQRARAADDRSARARARDLPPGSTRRRRACASIARADQRRRRATRERRCHELMTVTLIIAARRIRRPD